MNPQPWMMFDWHATIAALDSQSDRAARACQWRRDQIRLLVWFRADKDVVMVNAAGLVTLDGIADIARTMGENDFLGIPDFALDAPHGMV